MATGTEDYGINPKTGNPYTLEDLEGLLGNTFPDFGSVFSFLEGINKSGIDYGSGGAFDPETYVTGENIWGSVLPDDPLNLTIPQDLLTAYLQSLQEQNKTGEYTPGTSIGGIGSGFSAAQGLAGGIPFEDMVAPGLSFGPEAPMGTTEYLGQILDPPTPPPPPPDPMPNPPSPPIGPPTLPDPPGGEPVEPIVGIDPPPGVPEPPGVPDPQPPIMPPPPIMCFVAGTKIDMANGTQKVIENIKVGDIVLAKDNASDVVSYVHDIPKDDRSLWTINNRITATDAHAFLTEDGWKSNNSKLSNTVYNSYGIEVKDLQVGDKLITNEGVEEVTKLESSEDFVKVYNFTTNSTHTYMVDGVVSHNKLPPPDPTPPPPPPPIEPPPPIMPPPPIVTPPIVPPPFLPPILGPKPPVVPPTPPVLPPTKPPVVPPKLPPKLPPVVPVSVGGPAYMYYPSDYMFYSNNPMSSTLDNIVSPIRSGRASSAIDPRLLTLM